MMMGKKILTVDAEKCTGYRFFGITYNNQQITAFYHAGGGH